MVTRTRPLFREAHEVQPLEDVQSNVIKTDIIADLLEEENNTTTEVRAGLTEIQVTIENRKFKTLVDTGSEISVIAENILNELKEFKKNIPVLPVAGVTVIGVTGVRSKRVTKQIHLSFSIGDMNFDNTFLVVKGLSLDIILGNDFLQRNKAVINFKEKVLELDGGDRSVKINFENVINKVRTTGVKLLQKRVVENNLDTKLNFCREGEYLEDVDNEMSNINNEEWEIRADEFCSGCLLYTSRCV